MFTELAALQQPSPQPSPGRRSMSADVETYSRPRKHPGLERQLTVHVPPGGSPSGLPRLLSLCPLCRERVGVERLQQHSAVCVRLEELCKQVGKRGGRLGEMVFVWQCGDG